jgi:cytidyltransferase-like protein
MPQHIVVCGAFDDLRSRHLRFIEEAAKLGDLTVLLWSDDTVRQQTGRPPRFPEAERAYLLNAVRFVGGVRVVPSLAHAEPEAGAPARLLRSALQAAGFRPDCWLVPEAEASEAWRAFCREEGIAGQVLADEALRGFPEAPAPPSSARRKKVVVTGCYDWFHSGHVRFFEEVSAYGDLYVILGNDANLRLLKGAGHPLIHQDERRYVVGTVRHVRQALISSGEGWLDADPEIRRIRPDLYAVNEDGDRGGKREYCQQHGIEYLVLRRTPAPGLPQRTSTNLRGY